MRKQAEHTQLSLFTLVTESAHSELPTLTLRYYCKACNKQQRKGMQPLPICEKCKQRQVAYDTARLCFTGILPSDVKEPDFAALSLPVPGGYAFVGKLPQVQEHMSLLSLAGVGQGEDQFGL